MELATITLFTKIIGLAVKSWDAYCADGFDKKDIEALNQIVATAAGEAGARRGTPGAAAQHIGLILAAFGRAFERHWVTTRTLTGPSWVRRFLDSEEAARSEDIQTRLRMAKLAPAQIGDRAPETAKLAAEELAAAEGLIGHPLSSPVYRELWRVFSDPQLSLEGEEPSLDVSPGSRRAFERHFLLAYWQALNSQMGSAVREYLASVKHHRDRIVREVILSDIATWKERHVFGNVSREDWEEDTSLPFLPLGKMYIEPYARTIPERGGLESQTADNSVVPVLSQLRSWLGNRESPAVMVVRADFGMGKSLTARSLACELAQQYFHDVAQVSRDLWMPIFLRCADDFLGEAPSLDELVRRGLKRHGEAVGISLAADDSAFTIPERDQRVLIVLDGLDEVVLGQRALEGLFQRLADKATERHRVLVLSRPGVLPERRELKRAELIELCPFEFGESAENFGGQIDAWLTAWNQVIGRERPITAEALLERDLLELAATPILLFMIAYTWDEHALGTDASQAQVFESFMLQMARGKHELDRDRHKPVYEAAKDLRDWLVRKEELDRSAEPHEAMLWLLARLAWEERRLVWKSRLEQRFDGGKEKDGDEEARYLLTRRIVTNILADELKLKDDVAKTIEIGLLLALQSDPVVGRDHVHFGHKSFREFLVGRYWADRLRKLAKGRDRDWDKRMRDLLGARLLLPEDRSFEYLKQILKGESELAASPFAWTSELRSSVHDWAEDCFNNEDQQFARDEGDEGMRLRDDQRALLREAALAIGSTVSVIDDKPGIKAKSPWTLRSVLAWFWNAREPVNVYAPKAGLKGSLLSGVKFTTANFEGADLSEASFERDSLMEAVFREANLENANLSGANLFGVDLSGANLSRADLSGADLSGADLSGANLSGANLSGASLFGAVYDRATGWPQGFTPQGAFSLEEEAESTAADEPASDGT